MKKIPKFSKTKKEKKTVIPIVKKIKKPTVVESNPIKKTTVKTKNTTKQVVEPGDVITVDYIASLENNTIFDTTIETEAKKANLPHKNEYKPLKFTVGNGHIIKGFEKAVLGMKLNQTKKITIQPQEAYGKKDKKKLIKIPISALIHQGINPKKNIVLSTNIGHGIIVDVFNDSVIVDFNHALIGKPLKFEITVRTIKNKQ